MHLYIYASIMLCPLCYVLTPRHLRSIYVCMSVCMYECIYGVTGWMRKEGPLKTSFTVITFTLWPHFIYNNISLTENVLLVDRFNYILVPPVIYNYACLLIQGNQTSVTTFSSRCKTLEMTGGCSFNKKKNEMQKQWIYVTVT